MAGRKKTKTEDVSERYNKPFAKRLRALIEESRKSHAEIGQYFGVSRQGVGKWVNGETTPDVETIVNIAEYFRVSTDYLLGKTEIKSSDTTIQAVCEFTGLSEDAINHILDFRNRVSGKDTFFIKGINSLLSTSFIQSLAYYCTSLERESADLIELPPHSYEAVDFASRTLNIDKSILYEHIASMTPTASEANEIRDMMNRCDLLRYNISKISESMCNYYDWRSTYEYWEKAEWMKVLSLTDEKILELQEKGNHRQKEGD